MTLIVSSPPGTATAPDLAELARLATAADWDRLVRFSATERWYARLAATPAHEVWLLSWLPGQETGFHDHGGSCGAFTVVQGELRERTAAGGVPTEGRTLRPGDLRSFGRGYVHDVTNAGTEPAVSIHAYAPALATMTRYRLVDGRLVTELTERAGNAW